MVRAFYVDKIFLKRLVFYFSVNSSILCEEVAYKNIVKNKHF